MTLQFEGVSTDISPTRNWRHRTKWHPKNRGGVTVLEEHLGTSDTRALNASDPNDVSVLRLSNGKVFANIFEIEAGGTGATPSGPVSPYLVISGPESFSHFGYICLSQYTSETGSAGPAIFQVWGRPFPTPHWSSGQLVASNTTGTYGSFTVRSEAIISFSVSASLTTQSHDTVQMYDADAPVTYLGTVHSPMGENYDAATTVLRDHATPDIEYAISCIFNIDPMPEFEDGVNNAFSDGIENIVRKFGNEGVKELRKVFLSTQNLSCVGEALRKFGLIENETTMDERLQTLVALLKHWSAVVRDAATIGLAYLDDPRAIGPIDEAIQTEPVPVLRREMEATREQLAHR